MQSYIRLLPNHIANQIAAGEVVQRPASVVKELMENSVDAGATSIQLVVKDAGKTLIQVTDDGKGMNETDARMCFERHATSKISQAEDLFNLHTKGFRGEALASIAAIAHVDLKTKMAEADLGTHLVIEGSEVQSQEEAVLPNGTSFIVRNLFFNIPARRNFLKSDQVEMRHIIDEFQRVALAHPDIRFSLTHNDTEVFQLPASNFKQRIMNIFGGKNDERLVPVSEQTELMNIDGFVGKSEFAKKTRGEQFFFVNRRFIKNSYLHHAVQSAYEGLLKEGYQPAYFLFLEVPPSKIDINIHPTKTEVKFEDEKALYAILRSSIKHSLGHFQVAPTLDFQRDPSLDVPYEKLGTPAETPTIEVDTNYNPFKSTYNPFESSTSLKSGGSSGGFSRSSTGGLSSVNRKIDHWETVFDGLPESTEEVIQAQQFIEATSDSETLFDAVGTEEQQRFSVFQFKKKYIVSTIKSGVIIIDQVRAHQRILFEKYLKALKNEQAPSQQLLFSIPLYYSTYEMQLLKRVENELKAMGFVFESFTDEQVVVSGIPTEMTESEISMLLEDLLNELESDFPEETSVLHEHIAKSFAASSSVRTGTPLSVEQQENFVHLLFACAEPMVSPFGKPTYSIIDIQEIDKRFMK